MKSYHLNDAEIILKSRYPMLVLETSDEYAILTENVYSLIVAGQEQRVDPEVPMNATQEVALKRFCTDRLRRIDISDESHLTLTTVAGSAMSVGPDPDYEAWELDGPRRMKIICVPGGGLALWGEIDDLPPFDPPEETHDSPTGPH